MDSRFGSGKAATNLISILETESEATYRKCSSLFQDCLRALKCIRGIDATNRNLLIRLINKEFSSRVDELSLANPKVHDHLRNVVVAACRNVERQRQSEELAGKLACRMEQELKEIEEFENEL